MTLSDALLVFHDATQGDEQDSAKRFLQMLGAAYRQIDLMHTEYRDWVGRAGRTLADLRSAPFGDQAVLLHPTTDIAPAAALPDNATVAFNH